MLKIKKDLNYRRGYTHKDCSGCDFYVERHPCRGIGGVDLGEQPRCKVIGLENGRMYRICPNNICDRFDNTERMKRYRRPL